MRFVFLIEAKGTKRTVERVLLGLCVAAVAVAAPLGMARAARVQQAARHWNQGEEFIHERQWQEAELEFRASLKADPTFFPAREALADLAWSRQDYDACLREYEEACRVDPRNPEAWRARGEFHFRRREFAKAIAPLQQALALAPSDQRAGTLLRTCRGGAGGEAGRAPSVCGDGCGHPH